MTNRQAIERIEDHIRVHALAEPRADLIHVALRMAIEALKQPEIIRCKDCKYASGDVYCHCKYANWWNNPYDYCSRAERNGEADGRTD